jgi:hypothetical protein
VLVVVFETTLDLALKNAHHSQFSSKEDKRTQFACSYLTLDFRHLCSYEVLYQPVSFAEFMLSETVPWMSRSQIDAKL